MYGVDLAQKQLEILQKHRGNSTRLQIKTQQWDFGENGDVPWSEMKGKFKAIYAVHVFSHFSKVRLKKTLLNLKEWMAPGGIFITTIIDKDVANQLPTQTRSPKEKLRLHKLHLNAGWIEHSKKPLIVFLRTGDY